MFEVRDDEADVESIMARIRDTLNRKGANGGKSEEEVSIDASQRATQRVGSRMVDHDLDRLRTLEMLDYFQDPKPQGPIAARHGLAMAAAKRLIRKIRGPYHRAIFARQAEFNTHLVRLMEDLLLPLPSVPAASGGIPSNARPRRPKLTVAVPYPVSPPLTGGQLRISSLCRSIARAFNVELITLAGPRSTLLEQEVTPGVTEVQVPKALRHQEEEDLIAESTRGVPIAGVAIPLLFRHSLLYLGYLSRSVRTADVVLASYPYCLPAIRKYLDTQPLIYNAHNVEYLLYKELFSRSGCSRSDLLEIVWQTEAEACRSSALILACSMEDKANLCRIYSIEPSKVLVVPNGVDSQAVRFASFRERDRAKAEFGLAGQQIALFVGSWHPPNLEAAESIFDMARGLPQVRFILAGGQCIPLGSRSRPRNVGLMGIVDDETLTALLAVADVALNPMTSGSGTNHKIAMYLAAGAPVITTPHGARGYDLIDGEQALICPAEEFPGRIAQMVHDRALAERVARNGRRLVEERYDWSINGEEVAHALVSLLERRTSDVGTSRS